MELNVGVIGCGSWATVIANHVAKKGIATKLWAYREEICNEINESHSRQKCPGVKLDERLKAYIDLNYVLDESDVLICCMPSKYLQQTLENWKPYFDSSKPILNLTKGIVTQKELIISNYFKSFFPSVDLAVLSGPNLALEIGLGKPSATVIAAEKMQTAEIFQKVLHSDYFRVYTSDDVQGVICGGILKNIIAIASGCCDELNLGLNAKASLITRGLHEMIKFGMYFGGKKETFYGLSGIGDLIATCNSELSRNYQFGRTLVKVEHLKAINSKVSDITEGVNTTKMVWEFAKSIQLDMPITETMYRVLFDQLSVKDALKNLMQRKHKQEIL